jgi:hypothetical protein
MKPILTNQTLKHGPLFRINIINLITTTKPPLKIMIILVAIVRLLEGDFTYRTGCGAKTRGATVTDKVSFTEEFDEVVRAVTLYGTAVADAAVLGRGGDWRTG